MNNTTANPPYIEFDRVGLRYGRGEEVLSDISFSLPTGSFNVITGPSGAGKTSLLKLLYLHMRPSRGLISLFGDDVSLLDRSAIPSLKRRMGVVLQDFSLINHLSVFDNVALPLRVIGKNVQTYQDDLISLLKWVGLSERIHARPSTLSGGEKQRAAIARAIIGKPDILIADEPTGNIDPVMGARLFRLFTELNRLGTTIIIATHDKDLIPDEAHVFDLNAGTLTKERSS